jgi:hypothetical protein
MIDVLSEARSRMSSASSSNAVSPQARASFRARSSNFSLGAPPITASVGISGSRGSKSPLFQPILRWWLRRIARQIDRDCRVIERAKVRSDWSCSGPSRPWSLDDNKGDFPEGLWMHTKPAGSLSPLPSPLPPLSPSSFLSSSCFIVDHGYHSQDELPTARPELTPSTLGGFHT